MEMRNEEIVLEGFIRGYLRFLVYYAIVQYLKRKGYDKLPEWNHLKEVLKNTASDIPIENYLDQNTKQYLIRLIKKAQERDSIALREFNEIAKKIIKSNIKSLLRYISIKIGGTTKLTDFS